MRGRRLVVQCAVLVTALAAACSEAVDPTGGALPISVGLTVDATAGGAAEAYEQADAIAVTVRAGGTVVFDETQPFSPETGETRVRVRLDPTLAGSTVTVDAELRGSGAALFRGTGSATLQETGPTTLDVPLTAVVSGVMAANPVATFTAIGETLALSAAAIFATGDTVPNAAITWRSLDPAIVTVSGGTSATAQSEGTARLEASAAGTSAQTTATVVAQVARVTVTPPAATVSVGETTQFQAQAFDRNANALLRTFTWTASNGAVASVTTAGVALGVSSGVSNIVADAGDTQGSAVLTVVDVPLTPGGLAGTILNEATLSYRLTWEDRSTNETHFSVERRVNGGAYGEIAEVAANVTSFEATGVTGDVDFRVLACNTIGCSAPSNVVRLVFVGGPPVATTQDAPDIGVMAGTVTGTTPYTVRFQYGYDFGEGSEGECPCYEETAPMPGVGTQEFRVPVDLWYTDQTLYYRIVASNEFGESTGSLQSLSFPNVSTEASSSEWDYGRSVTFRAEVFVPGSGSNPIQSVAFEVIGTNPPYNAAVVDGTASVSTSSGGTYYSYSRSWTAPSSSGEIGGFLFVDVIVTFTSGATAYAPYLTLFEGGGSIR